MIDTFSFPATDLEAFEVELESRACVEASSLGGEDDGAFAFSENRGRKTLLSVFVVFNLQQPLTLLGL